MTRTRGLRAAASVVLATAFLLGPLPFAAAEGPGYGGDAGQLAVSWESAPAAEAPTSPTPQQSVPPSSPSTAPTQPSTQPSTQSSTQPSTEPSTQSTPETAAPTSETPAPQAPVAPSAEPVPVESAPADTAATPSVQSLGGAARGVGAIVILPPMADPQLQSDALALMVRGLGFRSKSTIEVRIGSDQPVVARADTAGALAVALDPAKLGGAQPGVSVMAVGRNQAGTEVTLFGSIPPVADGSGPMSLVPWGVAAVALLGLALWMRRRHAAHEQPDADDAPDAPDALAALPA